MLVDKSKVVRKIIGYGANEKPVSDTKLMYTKKDVQRAGEALILPDVETQDQEKFGHAMKVLSNWRACHEYPLYKVTEELQGIVQKIDKNSFVVRRLKRTPSIISKLLRFEKMKLRNMQDIGGCRAVVARKKHVYKTLKLLNKNKDYRVTDYIETPKDDGYRGVHLIKKFPSSDGKNMYPVEIQLRSKVQHCWATAVEIVDLFTNQAIKSNDGKKDWMDFFRHVSNEFNDLEKLSEYSPTESLSEVYRLVKKLSVYRNFAAFRHSLQLLEIDETVNFDGYFLLKINFKKKTLEIKEFPYDDFANATENYLREERKYALNTKYVVALVSSRSISNLKEAYPNYFADSTIFIEHLRIVCARYKFHNPSWIRRFLTKIPIKQMF